MSTCFNELDRYWYGSTHWGRVTHICVSKLNIIGSDNGLAPGRHQAIIWTNAGILLIGPFGISFSEIENYTFSFKKMHLKCRQEIGGHFVLASMRGALPPGRHQNITRRLWHVWYYISVDNDDLISYFKCQQPSNLLYKYTKSLNLNIFWSGVAIIIAQFIYTSC